MVDSLHDLQHQNQLAKLRIDRLKEKLSTIIADQSVVLDEGTSKDMKEIMQEEEEQVTRRLISADILATTERSCLKV